MRGRESPLIVTLTPSEMTLLRRLTRAQALPAGIVRRAQVVVLRADGRSITAIAIQVGMSRRHVQQWLQRYLAGGIDALWGKREHDRRRRMQIRTLNGTVPHAHSQSEKKERDGR